MCQDKFASKAPTLSHPVNMARSTMHISYRNWKCGKVLAKQYVSQLSLQLGVAMWGKFWSMKSEGKVTEWRLLINLLPSFCWHAFCPFCQFLPARNSYAMPEVEQPSCDHKWQHEGKKHMLRWKYIKIEGSWPDVTISLQTSWYMKKLVISLLFATECNHKMETLPMIMVLNYGARR